jgi:RNA polymerase sigma-70 factor (ECF subfamily)
VRELLGSVYRDHRQGLFSLALSITGDANRAEDAIHDAFERLFRRLGKPAGDPIAYVFAAVRNASLDQLRRKPRPTAPDSIFEFLPAVSEPSPDHAACDAERDRLVRAALDSLPDAQREAVVMRLYSGLSFEQMAEATREPMSTVASRYRRALQSLRASVETLV